jgi:hypothetical protein
VQVALENATSYEDWARAALELDDLDGMLNYVGLSLLLLIRPEYLEK